MTESERLTEIARLEVMIEASRGAGGGYKDRIAAIGLRLVVLRGG